MRLLIPTLDILVWFLEGKNVMSLTVYSDIELRLLGCLYRSNSRRIHRMSRALDRIPTPLPITLQGAIGILDRRDMDHFAEIFLALQKRGMTKDEKGTN